MNRFGPGTEECRIGRSRRRLNLEQTTADPIVGELSLAEATVRLQDGMTRIKELAEVLERPSTALALMSPDETRWFLVLDHDELAGEASRLHLPSATTGVATADFSVAAAAVPDSQLVEPIELDPLTVMDDRDFLEEIEQQQNLPDYVRTMLADLY
jgi:hypothetical protein